MKCLRPLKLQNGTVEMALLDACECHDRRGPSGGVCGNCGGAIPYEVEARAELIHDWNNFRQAVALTPSPPAGVGLAEIAKAKEILKL